MTTEEMHTHSKEELELICTLAKLDGKEVVGELLCCLDPEGYNNIDIRLSEDQNDKRPFGPKWNFLYPVYVSNCRCEEKELLENLGNDWDQENKKFIPQENPPRFFGHSILCLQSVPLYTQMVDFVLELARKVSITWGAETRQQFSDIILSKPAEFELEKFIVKHSITSQ